MGETIMKLLPAFAIVVAVATALSAQSSKVDVTGKWTFTVQTDAGSGTPTVTLKQDGEKLTGHYSSQNLGEADLTGSVKGQEIKFTFNVDAQGTSLTVTYTGTIESKDSMKARCAPTPPASGDRPSPRASRRSFGSPRARDRSHPAARPAATRGTGSRTR